MIDMQSKKSSFILGFFKLIITAFMTFSIYECFIIGYNPILPIRFYWKGELLIAAAFAFIYILSTGIYDAFDIKLSRVSEIIFSQLLSVGIADSLMYVILIFIFKGLPTIIPALITLAIQIVFIFIWSILAKKIYFHSVPPLRTIIINDDDTDMQELIKKHNLDIRFDIDKTITVADCIDNLSVLDSYEAIFLHDNDVYLRNKIVKYCVEKGIKLFAIPHISDMIVYGAKSRHMLHLPVMKIERYNPSAYFLFAKRAFDIALSLILIIILSPLLLITAIAVKACDGGPCFYKQTRITKNGKLFKIIKFRSMRVDAEKNGAQLSTGDKDDRITPVGRIIRKCRLDELPQLFNILGGSMSFVGPRPERPEIAEEYYKDLPEFSLRLQAKAGLTGYAQIYGKYNTTPYDKLKMDLMYISRPGISKDISLMLATLKILFVAESTEGVDQGVKNAAKPMSDTEDK